MMTSEEKLADAEIGEESTSYHASGEHVEVTVGPGSNAMRPSQRGHKFDNLERDPNIMNDHVKVFFQDVFAEPDGSHSIDGIWRASYTTFTATKYCCYRLLTAIFGVPTAILCGCLFAFLSFDYVWCIMPCLRAYIIELQCLGKVFGLLVKTFCDPFFESVGRIFSGIRHVKVKATNNAILNA